VRGDGCGSVLKREFDVGNKKMEEEVGRESRKT
jgi:hypothetical protein